MQLVCSLSCHLQADKNLAPVKEKNLHPASRQKGRQVERTFLPLATAPSAQNCFYVQEAYFWDDLF